MKVSQLIELLEQYDDELEVRIMSQPNWPFEYSVRSVCDRNGMGQDLPEDDLDDPNIKPNAVFIVEGSQMCYGDKRAWEVE